MTSPKMDQSLDLEDAGDGAELGEVSHGEAAVSGNQVKSQRHNWVQES